jgi:hypothetical protein
MIGVGDDVQRKQPVVGPQVHTALNSQPTTPQAARLPRPVHRNFYTTIYTLTAHRPPSVGNGSSGHTTPKMRAAVGLEKNFFKTYYHSKAARQGQ